jgi:26S proteasome regulatory subunit N3
MRNYLEANLLEQADNFNSKTTFPEVNPNETARHMYYVGRIRTVQLEYSEAYACLMQAVRKAPQIKAPAFRATVNKLLVIVQLLMGEVPERKFFNQGDLVKDLEPYCALAGAVRLGDLVQFAKVSENYGPGFLRDHNHNLIVRLRHNVIKAGLRKLNISYSRISLSDICEKLAFDSVQATECVVAKAIRDGVIDGVINHNDGYLQSNETLNIYATNEPQEAFKKRIRFCLDIHNEAIMAMRYPEDAHKDKFETAEDRLAREKEESELAKTLEDEDEEDTM